MEIAMIKEIQFHRPESPGGIASSPCLTMRVGPDEVYRLGGCLLVVATDARKYWTLVPLSQVTLHGDGVPAELPEYVWPGTDQEHTAPAPARIDVTEQAATSPEKAAGPAPVVTVPGPGDIELTMTQHVTGGGAPYVSPAPGKGKKR